MKDESGTLCQAKDCSNTAVWIESVYKDGEERLAHYCYHHMTKADPCRGRSHESIVYTPLPDPSGEYDVCRRCGKTISQL